MSGTRNSGNSIDDVIDVYKKNVDLSLLAENLKKTPEERLIQLQQLQRFAEELRKSGEKLRRR